MYINCVVVDAAGATAISFIHSFIHSFVPDDGVVRATLPARVVDEMKIRHGHFQTIVALDALFFLLFVVVVVVWDVFFVGVLRSGRFLLFVR